MVQRIGGFRRKTRFKLQKSVREKGKISIKKFLQILTIGQKVGLSYEPAIQKGMYHPRFHGKIGTVIGQRGECYLVSVKQGKSLKTVVSHPIHLKIIQNEPKTNI